jgi:ABC-2 type transport system permease protein
LEVTGETFQAIGHLTPVAWAMDGFTNILVRKLDLSSIWLPAAALLGYAVVFCGAAVWKFSKE